MCWKPFFSPGVSRSGGCSRRVFFHAMALPEDRTEHAIGDLAIKEPREVVRRMVERGCEPLSHFVVIVCGLDDVMHVGGEVEHPVRPFCCQASAFTPEAFEGFLHPAAVEGLV